MPKERKHERSWDMQVPLLKLLSRPMFQDGVIHRVFGF